MYDVIVAGGGVEEFKGEIPVGFAVTKAGVTRAEAEITRPVSLDEITGYLRRWAARGRGERL